MKQQVKVTRKNIASTVSVLVLAVALAFLAACAQKSGTATTAKTTAANKASVVEIADATTPLAGAAVKEETPAAAPVAAVPVADEAPIAVPAVNVTRPTIPVAKPEVTEPEVTEPEVTEPEVTEPEVTEPEVTEPEVTEPEVTEPEVTEPEVTEPEVTEPEVTEPEVTEPEMSGTDKGIIALWNQLKTEGSTANVYFSNRAAGTSLDSAGPNWAPEVNAALAEAGIGSIDNNVYSAGWRIWKDNGSFNIFFTEEQLAGAAAKTELEDVAKANTADLTAAEAAGDATDAIVDGTAEVAVKNVKNAQNENVSVSYIVGGSFEADDAE